VSCQAGCPHRQVGNNAPVDDEFALAAS
jgi:hypothetical protein